MMMMMMTKLSVKMIMTITTTLSDFLLVWGYFPIKVNSRWPTDLMLSPQHEAHSTTTVHLQNCVIFLPHFPLNQCAVKLCISPPPPPFFLFYRFRNLFFFFFYSFTLVSHSRSPTTWELPSPIIISLLAAEQHHWSDGELTAELKDDWPISLSISFFVFFFLGGGH